MDSYLLSKLDCVTTWAQRRGYLLTDIRVHVSGFCAVSCVARDFHRYLSDGGYTGIVMAVIDILIWGVLNMGLELWEANKAKDYQVSVSTMERLNARVLEYRENDVQRFLRLGLAWLAILGLPFDILIAFEGKFSAAIVDFLSSMAPALLFYVRGCFYLGPGEFNKSKQDVTTGKEITVQGS